MKQIHTLTEAIALLKYGAVIAHPADTCFGLTGDLMNPDVLKKIQKIKGRDAKKPMSIFIPNPTRRRSFETSPSPVIQKALKNYVKLSDFAKEICNKLLPGPVTIILPKGPRIPDWYFPETQWIGIRMVDDENVNALLNAFGGPLITTSANLTGEATCYTTEEVEKAFKNSDIKPDGILVGEITDPKPPSTVIKIDGDRIEVLREGPVLF